MEREYEEFYDRYKADKLERLIEEAEKNDPFLIAHRGYMAVSDCKIKLDLTYEDHVILTQTLNILSRFMKKEQNNAS